MSSLDFTLRHAARSDTGLVRKNNQDSGYAGPDFLLVADGMGGHAGGDVASAITVARLSDLDAPGHGGDALDVLRQAILDANERITTCVAEQPELAGMGTTVTALLRTGDRLALAHIGDSRAYLLRDGELSLVTRDHTFVQMLVDEGRITPEEAESHPQRSVVMRVLGDVGSAPELDLSFRDTRLGDRWMLCSDGLTGFASIEDIQEALADIADPGACCDRLVDLALAGGGADNVTVVIGDVVAPEDAAGAGAAARGPGESVGSVRTNPQYALLGRTDTPTELIPTGPLDTVDESADTQQLDVVDAERTTPDEDGSRDEQGSGDEHGNRGRGAPDSRGARTGDTQEIPTDSAGTAAATAGPGAAHRDSAETRAHPDDDLDGWGAEERPRRRLLPLLITILVLASVAIAGVVGWNWVRGQYYVGAESGTVAIYRGVAQTLGPLELSSLDETTDIPVDELSAFSQSRLEATIPAGDRAAADQVVETLRDEAAANAATEMQGGVTDAPVSPDPASPDPASPAPAPAEEPNAAGGP
ncbi:protein phosphatase 2C domain-containing protein [Nocardia zapadnayensis]|nr:PP2C family serine/threonine-protein phosphatase [Nocardia zapadnayensis]MCX0278239.1 protein phosphatase 2C domain-containing protein [Nocardia zapadnayensis]